MDEIKFRAVVDDSDIARFVNDAIESGAKAQASIDAIGGAADQTTKKMVQGLKDTEREIINSTRAADQLRRTIKENEEQVKRLNAQMKAEQLLLKQLQKEYRRLGDKSSQDAKRLQANIDNLDASIRQAATDTEILADQTQVLRDDLAKTGRGFERSEQQAGNLTLQLKEMFVQLATGQMSFRELIQQGPQLTKVFGGFRNTSRALFSAIGNGAKRVISLRGAVGLLAGSFVGIIAIPIITFLTKSTKVAEFFSEKIAYLNGAFKELGDRLFRAGEALFNWVTGAGSAAEVGQALVAVVDDLGNALDRAGDAAVSYDQKMKALQKEQRDFIVEEGKKMAIIDEQRRIYDDNTRSFKARAAALRIAMVEEQRLEAQRIKFAEGAYERIRNEATLTDGLIDPDREEEVNRAYRALIDARSKAFARQYQDEQALIELGKEKVEAYRKEQAAIAELRREVQAFRDQFRDFQNEDATGLDKIRIDAIKALEQVDNLEQSLRAAYEARKLQFDLEQEFAAFRSAIQARATQEIAAELAKQARAEEKERREALEAEQQRVLREIDLREELALTRAEIERRAGLSELEAERALELDKLNIQRSAAAERLEIVEQQYGPTSLRAQLIRAEIEQIAQQVNSLGSAELTGLERFADRIKEALNLSDADVTAIKGLLMEIGTSFADLLGTVTEAQISAKQAQIDQLEAYVDETEKALNDQLKLQEQGFANDADLLKQNLTAKQELLEKAEAEKLALEKKAARERLRIEALQQGSAYVSTVLNLLNSEIRNKGLVGFFTALGGIALIAKTVAKARATAKQFEAPGFRDGTPYLDGPGDGRSDSILLWGSKGERITSAAANAAIGGRSLSEPDLVKYVQLGKLAEIRPDFAEVDAKTAGVIIEHRRLTETERAQEKQMMREAYREAARESTREIIQYLKTRPVKKLTADGEVIEFYEGGTKVTQNIKKK